MEVLWDDICFVHPRRFEHAKIRCANTQIHTRTHTHASIQMERVLNNKRGKPYVSLFFHVPFRTAYTVSCSSTVLDGRVYYL